MPFSHPRALRGDVVGRVQLGDTPVQVARALGLSPTTVYAWLHELAPGLVRVQRVCFRCSAQPPPDPLAYSQLLGYYLGDGCVSRGPRAWVLRITCDDAWPGVADEVALVMGRVVANSVHRAGKQGCHDVQAYSQHWPCLFPQHGAGAKHLRRIELAPWQHEVVVAYPGPFLKGLFHSDGWRGQNVAVRTVADRVERRYYPRYDFTNKSDDIRALCGDALDRLGIAWRPNGPWRISVARRDAVAALDVHVGPKH